LTSEACLIQISS